MDRLILERRQVGVYLIAVLSGLAFGHLAPGVAAQLEVLIWPALALLLYATFVPIPLLHVGEGLRDHRFLAASTLGNFVALPLLVWGLLWWLPEEPAVRLGVAMVLVMP